MLDNFWEPAQCLARQWFLEHAGREAPLWDHAEAGTPPEFDVAAGWQRRRAVAEQVRTLWRYATCDPARRIPRREFERLGALLQSVASAVASGELVFRHGTAENS
jgi:hypothetical protein